MLAGSVWVGQTKIVTSTVNLASLEVSYKGRRERGKAGEREGGREGRRERGKEGERERVSE